MKIESLGHLVFKVRDIDRSVRFYTQVLGFREVGRTPSGAMVFFSLAGNHHDLGIQRVEPGAPDLSPLTPGLAHAAWKLGTDLQLLKDARQHLEANGVTIRAVMDHVVTKSLYFSDPDGNPHEVFVESDPSVWRSDPSVVASGRPLDL